MVHKKVENNKHGMDTIKNKKRQMDEKSEKAARAEAEEMVKQMIEEESKMTAKEIAERDKRWAKVKFGP